MLSSSVTSVDNNAFNFDVSKYPALPRLRGIFVTGTDTGVGKTLIAGAIASRLRQLGRRVEVFKPVATGCRGGRGGLMSDDAAFLAAMADSRRTLGDISRAVNNLDRNPTRLLFGPATTATPQASVPAPAPGPATERRRP